MTESHHADKNSTLYRVDSFIVPAEAYEDFLERLFIIRDFLASQHGCRYNRIADAPARWQLAYADHG